MDRTPHYGNNQYYNNDNSQNNNVNNNNSYVDDSNNESLSNIGDEPFLDKKTKEETIYRATLGIPLMAVGGAVGTYGLKAISSIVISPLAGAFVGACLMSVNVITNIAFTKLGLDDAIHTITELVTDLFITTMVSFAVFSYFGAPISLFRTILLIPTAVLGMGALFITSTAVAAATIAVMNHGFNVSSSTQEK